MIDINHFLLTRKEQGLFRDLKPITNRRRSSISINNNSYIDFSSNDYLGLAENENLKEKAIKTLQEHGMGSTGSRLISGDYTITHKLEKETAKLKNKASSLLFNSGYQANVGIISCLLDKQDAIFADKYSHASLLDGIKLSGAKLFRFKHNNISHLEELLKKHRHKFSNALIITESIFSMDGDKAPLKEISQLKTKYNCLTLVDEAHATGLFGENGSGLVNETNTTTNTDLIVGTFGKALGGFGAYVACSEEIKHFLINSCRSFIYSTALPPAVSAWNLESINMLYKEPERRQSVLEKATILRKAIQDLGLATPSESQIVPIITGGINNTIPIAQAFTDAGYWVLPIRPPTVPKGQSRIRISINWHHSLDSIQSLIGTIRNICLCQTK
jgi:8-amino-7-oxononanoate synthase